MSELKIVKNGLQNGILKDGQMAFGVVLGNDSSITSTSDGAFAHGFILNAGNNHSIIASGRGSYASGYVNKGNIIASGYGAHASGYVDNGNIIASGYGAHAEGYNTNASSNYSHAEGWSTTASGPGSHTEGRDTSATNYYAHAEGWSTTAFGIASHAEGLDTYAGGKASHTEGYNTATIKNSRTEYVIPLCAPKVYEDGDDIARGFTSIDEYNIENYIAIIGNNEYTISSIRSIGKGDYFAYIFDSPLSGNYQTWFTTHDNITCYKITTDTVGDYAHAEGQETLALGTASHAEGYYSETLGIYSHAEGQETLANGEASHAEGYKTCICSVKDNLILPKPDSFFAYGQPSYTEFRYSSTLENDLIQIGNTQILINNKYFTIKSWSIGPTCAFVYPQLTENDINWANNENNNIYIVSNYSHAEGSETITCGRCCHSEGGYTKSCGNYSHAEGYETEALALYSHASGIGTKAYAPAQTVIGQYNVCPTSFLDCLNNQSLFLIGNGNSNNRRDALYVKSKNSVTTTDNCILHINGNLEVTAGAYQTSDINLKNIISDNISLEKAYEVLEKCHTVLYTLKDDKSNKEQIGMIAQEVQEYFPEIVNKSSDNTLSLDYSRLSVILFRLCKELFKKNQEFNQRLSAIEEKLSKL